MNSSASLKWDSTGARPNMTSVFDFDDAINAAYNAKTAGKNLVTAKHEVLTKAGDFLFLAHSDKEFALRCQMMEADIESAAKRKMASVSDSKFKLVRALHEEWKIRHASCSMCKTASGEWSAMGRATGEGMVCNGGGKGEVLNVHSCGTANPLGGLGHNTGLCIPCEEKLGMKAPGHDYTGQTFNDHTTASKIAEKMCVECKKRPATKKAHGYLDVCEKCDKAQGTTGSAKSPFQEKIAGLKTRIATPFELDKAPGRDVYSVTSQLGPEVAQQFAAKYAGRTADRPEMQSEAKAGRWALITKHDDEGKFIDATLGRIGGSDINGDAETSPLICTGNTHHGNSNCQHSAGDAFGGRHIAIQETPAMDWRGSLVPRLTQRKEASIYAPSHRVHILPQEDHDKIEDVMNEIASKGVSAPGINIPPFKREEEGRGKLVETFGQGREETQGPTGVNTRMGGSHGVGKISNFTIWPSTADFGHSENELAANRGGANEGMEWVLESGPKDLKGSRKTNPNFNEPLERGKAGSGRVLPVASMVPMREASDANKGLQGALPDGSLADVGVTAKLRPVAWGNNYSAPTFKFIEGLGKVKSTGGKLYQKLTELNEARKSRIATDRVENSSSPTKRAPTKRTVDLGLIDSIMQGKEEK